MGGEVDASRDFDHSHLPWVELQVLCQQYLEMLGVTHMDLSEYSFHWKNNTCVWVMLGYGPNNPIRSDHFPKPCLRLRERTIKDNHVKVP